MDTPAAPSRQLLERRARLSQPRSARRFAQAAHWAAGTNPFSTHGGSSTRDSPTRIALAGPDREPNGRGDKTHHRTRFPAEDRKSTRLDSSHKSASRMPSSAFEQIPHEA